MGRHRGGYALGVSRADRRPQPRLKQSGEPVARSNRSVAS
jgi:hypothetical protein